ncbi:MAG: TatD family hydrolase [Candidatus Phytoplasma sp.]|nr:TatD family hydrolase [Phytoplasma sp.]
MIIDTHAHLNTKDFENRIEEVIKNAFLLDVQKVIVIGMDEESNKQAIKLAEQYENIYATIGIHPSYVDQENYESIEKYLTHPKVVAVGEIGIDLYWRQDNLDKQKLFLKKQIEIALKYDLPIVVHTRESFKETYEIISQYKGQIKGVFHCLTSTIEDMKQALKIGFYIGVGGVVTFPKATNVHDIVKNLPLDKMLVETDSPYLAPVPYRGKKNEPAYTKYVVDKIAEIKQIDVETIKKETTLNALKLFNIKG